MPNVLEVQIVGDVSSLEKSLNDAKKLQADYTASIEKTSSELKESITVTNGYKKAIDDLNSELKSGAISSKDYSKQLANLKRDEKESAVATENLRKELANLKREQKDLSGGYGTLSKKTADGSNALNQFSRIAQDAPFGIQGIGNNITATVEAFGHLQKSTGSTGAALKAVASSMLGSGGILLAVSLVTTGLTYMAQNGLTVGDVFDKLNGTFDETSKALSDVNKEAAKTAGEEIAVIKGLVSAASDVTLSTEKRLLAVKKLQEEYPAYFGNLTREQILNGQVAGAVDDVSKALIARARASAIAGKLGENAAKRLDLEEKRELAILAIQRAQLLVAKNKNKTSTGGGGIAGQGGGFTTVDDQAKNALANLSSEYKNIITQIKELDAQSKKFSDREAQATKDSIGLLEEQADVAKKAKTPKAAKVKKDTFDEQKSLDKLSELAFQMQEVTDVPLFDTKKTEQNLDKLTELASEMGFTVTSKFDLVKESANMFSEGVGSAIGTLGSELASSLETGNAALDAFVGSVISGLADIAAAQLSGFIAQQLLAKKEVVTSAGVSTAKAIESGTKTAAASGPAAAFLLPALIGAAVGFVAASFAGIKFAHGGIVPGGSYTGDKIPAMLNSGEAVMNSQQQANTLMAIANGNSNALQSNRKSSTFNLETKLRGSDILLALKREEKSR